MAEESAQEYHPHPREADEGESLARENGQLRQRIDRLLALQNIAIALGLERDPKALAEKIVRMAASLLHAEAATLFLTDEATGELVFEIVHGAKSAMLRGLRLKPGQGVCGWVASHGTPAIVNDARRDERFYNGIDNLTGMWTSSLLCVPLQVRGRIIGVLEAVNKGSGEPFDEEDQLHLMALASQAAIALENAQLLQRLAQEKDHILLVQEEMRRQLSRSLHDGPAQSLAAIAGAIHLVRRVGEREPQRVPQELAKLEALVRDTNRELRTLLFELRPYILETRGLVAALKEYVERLRDEGFQIHFRPPALGRLEAAQEATIFTVLQEALHNAKKHAQASQIWLKLERRGTELWAEVRDNGAGFDPATVEASYDARGSFGLLNMRERAKLVGGSLLVEAAPGRGTKVSLRVPLGPKSQGASVS